MDHHICLQIIEERKRGFLGLVFRVGNRLLVNSYDRASAHPDDVGQQKGCKVRIARHPPGTMSQLLESWYKPAFRH